MKKGQKVTLKSNYEEFNSIMQEYLSTVTTTPKGWVESNNDCYWFKKDAFFNLCTKDDEHCIGMKKCKFYETEFQHQVRVTIEKAEKDE